MRRSRSSTWEWLLPNQAVTSWSISTSTLVAGACSRREPFCDLGLDVYEAAATFWGGGYDPDAETITQGALVRDIPLALKAAERLYLANYAAGQAVDAHRATLAESGIPRTLAQIQHD